jgi:pimeloyl-ACP methyl ester carboxylesterase
MPLLNVKDGKGTTLYYEFLSKFDPTKETLLLLPGFLCNASFNAPQHNDQGLRSRFNLLAIEMRCFSGRSTSKELTLELDISVQAAEIAYVRPLPVYRWR